MSKESKKVKKPRVNFIDNNPENITVEQLLDIAATEKRVREAGTVKLDDKIRQEMTDIINNIAKGK